MSRGYTTFGNDIWYQYLKPNLVFPTEKIIRIVDWRLALTFRGLQIAIVSYFLWDAVFHQHFLLKVEPDNILSLYVSDGDAVALQKEFYQQQVYGDDSDDNYCNRNSSYHYKWSESWQYLFNGCVALIPGMLAKKVPIFTASAS
ncbi:hypothetical protein CYMTET_33971 [Cymbomonas tetramitiformis]|uniref:Uncharacterized protein n=1 Tax=Cymbomonas tetramitiformis TaxID=36881 RepID=A0AAE0FC38_9CHLO|nr:hypothetical protein CYMTET_33971 [Cymbomonas tetramitiformis]